MNYKTFRFHRFSNEESKYPLSFGNTFTIRYPQTNPSTTNNFQTQRFPQTFMLTTQRNQDYDENPLLINQICKIDFLTILQSGKFQQIEKVLPEMLYQKFKGNPHLVTLTSSFQVLLHQLFKYQEEMINANNQIENQLQSETNVFNIQKNKIEKKKNEIDNKIDLNNMNIIKLQSRISKYKVLLISSGNQSKIPSQTFPLDLHDENGYFYCQICPKKRFKSYDKVHEHYVKHHLISINDNKVNSDGNFQQYYIEDKLNHIKEELMNTFIQAQTERKKGLEKRRKEPLRESKGLVEVEQKRIQTNRIIIKESSNKNQSVIPKEGNNEKLKSIIEEIQNQQNQKFNQLEKEFKELKQLIMSIKKSTPKNEESRNFEINNLNGKTNEIEINQYINSQKQSIIINQSNGENKNFNELVNKFNNFEEKFTQRETKFLNDPNESLEEKLMDYQLRQIYNIKSKEDIKKEINDKLDAVDFGRSINKNVVFYKDKIIKDIKKTMDEKAEESALYGEYYRNIIKSTEIYEFLEFYKEE